jgi:hypothetical protein
MVLAYDSNDMPGNCKDIMGYARNTEEVERLIHTAKNNALYSYDHIETVDAHLDKVLITIRRNKDQEWHS